MDSPSGPSIMGSENPKFTERRLGRSDSEASDVANMADANSHNMSSRKSKDGLTRDERIKLVRERQMLEHKRRLDELKQAQMIAFKAKQQQATQKRRFLEELRNRDEQRRNEVLARKRKLEEIERNRKEAILRKHQEIFDRIDNKRRQHESRRMAYGLSTYRLSEQDDTMLGNDMSASRRAVSVGALASRNRGSMTQRSHHHSVVLSPNSSQSARTRGSPGTPSRNGGPLDFANGSKAGSNENSPAHSWRPPRSAQSHPPPTNRHRPAETARSRQGSRPTTAQAEPASARAKRPTSLMTRSLLQPAEVSKTAASTPDTSANFRTLSKRSQSVGNVSARRQKKPPQESSTTLQPARSEVEIESPRRTEEVVRFESSPKLPSTPENPEAITRTGRKVISEAEAKAALAEKRRLARLKLETEKNASSGLSLAESMLLDSQPSSSGFEEPESGQTLDVANRRASVAEFVELEKSFTEESNGLSRSNSVSDINNLHSDEEASVGTGVLVSRVEEEVRDYSDMRGEGDQRIVESQNSNIEEAIENVREGVEEIVHLLEEVPESLSRQIESPATESRMEAQNVERNSPENYQEIQPVRKTSSVEIPLSPPVETETFVRPEEPHQPSPPAPAVDPAIDEFRRRKLEEEQREEEERNARRQRLEAIKRMTKSGSGLSTTLTGSTDRLSTLASPVTETAKPIDALENARKLLQRRGMGGSNLESPSVVSKTFGDVIEEPRSLSGTPLSDVSSTDTVSLSGFVRGDGSTKGHNGFHEETNPFNGSGSAMSNGSSVDFDPFRGNGEWNGVSENGTEGSHYWNGSTMNGTHAGSGIRMSSSDMLLNFDTS